MNNNISPVAHECHHVYQRLNGFLGFCMVWTYHKHGFGITPLTQNPTNSELKWLDVLVNAMVLVPQWDHRSFTIGWESTIAPMIVVCDHLIKIFWVILSHRILIWKNKIKKHVYHVMIIINERESPLPAT